VNEFKAAQERIAAHGPKYPPMKLPYVFLERRKSIGASEEVMRDFAYHHPGFHGRSASKSSPFSVFTDKKVSKNHWRENRLPNSRGCFLNCMMIEIKAKKLKRESGTGTLFL
jgi:hypothetical protein